MAMESAHDVIIDGYNFIKTNEMFRLIEQKNIAEARHLLIRQLQNKYRRSTQRVTVVFDGNGVREQVSHDEHICIIYSRAGETADNVIKRLTGEARSRGRRVEMYSNDVEVRDAVVERGGHVQKTQSLAQRLNAAPRDVEIRAQHRIQIKREYGMEPWRKGEFDRDDEPPRSRRGRKKKRRRR